MRGKLPEPSPLSGLHHPNSQGSREAGVDHGGGGGGAATFPSRHNVATIHRERTAKPGRGCGRRTGPTASSPRGARKAPHVTPLAAWGQQEPLRWRSGLSAGPQPHCGQDSQPEDTLHGHRPVPREAEQGSSRQFGATEAAGAPAASEAAPPAPVPTPHAMETQLKRHHTQGDRWPGHPDQVSTNMRPARASGAPWLLGDGQRQATKMDGVETQLSCLRGHPDAEPEQDAEAPGEEAGMAAFASDTIHFRAKSIRS